MRSMVKLLVFTGVSTHCPVSVRACMRACVRRACVRAQAIIRIQQEEPTVMLNATGGAVR